MQVSIFAQSNAQEEIKLKCNVTCAGCKASIENGMSGQKGIKSVDASIEEKVVTIAYNPDETNADAISKALKEVGYANKVLDKKNECTPECQKTCCVKDKQKDCTPECQKECCKKAGKDCPKNKGQKCSKKG